MKQLIILFISILSFYTIRISAADRKLKVACVGNSITFGAGIANRDLNSYPAQLQYFLGDEYEIKNFGVSGTTALSKGDHPYIKTSAFKESQAYLPDIVLIKLGTNDTKPQNWKYKHDFQNDYQKLIDTYRNLSSSPRVILLTPVRCFLPENAGISPKIIEQEIRPVVEQLAWKNRLDIINLFNLFGNQWDASLMPDKLHPSAIGAGRMAKKIGNYLEEIEQKQIENEPLTGSPFNFHGYQGYDLEIDHIPCKIVKPYVTASGKPWVLRARFWNHEPQTDIALLEHGFHIAYCDVADLYGSEKAIKRWDRFYQYMIRSGFNKKVVLEGMSRGGLIVYNWAAQNPKKVACIYADAPVMDLKSWPMGEGQYEGSETDIQQMLKAYGFKNKEQALAWKKNPTDHAKKIAKAKIPVLHVVGDADKIVPVAENTAIFEQRMIQYDHPIRVIHKPGIGHHPHSLNNPEQIVRFILNATGFADDVCTHAVPGNEFRSGAGWAAGNEWHSIAQDIENSLDNKDFDFLFLGNSITQGWGGNRKEITYRPGEQVMNQYFGKDTWGNAGISGDKTQNLLWRIQHGNYNRCHPDNVIIAIGINNLIAGDTPEETAQGILAVTGAAQKEFSESRIILLGLYPSGKEANSNIRKKCNRIHELLAEKKWKDVEYINPTNWFTDNNGNIKDGLYIGDYIHLSENGYKIVAEKLKHILSTDGHS